MAEGPHAGMSFDPIAEARRQWEAHGWSDAAPGMALVTTVTRVQQVFQARVEEVVGPLGLSFARFELLRLLAFTRTGALPLGKLSVRLQVHQTSITSAVDRLEAQGLVRRVKHPTDGRAVLAEITTEGRRVVRTATKRLNDRVFGDLGVTPEQCEQLIELLNVCRRAAGDLA